MEALKTTRFEAIVGDEFEWAGEKIKDKEDKIVGVKCQHCEFNQNPVGSHYCGKCGQNITFDNHVWEVYDASSCAIYYKDGNRVISDIVFDEYERYEKIVNTIKRYVKIGGTVLFLLAILVVVVIVWFFPELCGEKTPLYKQGTANLVMLILGTIAALIFVALFGLLIKTEIEEEY